MELPVGAKPGGMGDAYIAAVDDALAIYHNPAKVAFFKTIYSDISFGTEGFPFVDNWSLLYGKPHYEASYFGFGFISRKNDFEGRVYRSYQFLIPTVARISHYSSAGINLKYVTQKAGSGDYKTKLSPDFGFYYGLGILGYAFTVRNFIDPGMRSFPIEYNSGLSLKTESMILEFDVFGGRIEDLVNESAGMRIGGEMLISNYAFRAGYYEHSSGHYYTTGFGIYSLFKVTGFEYCYRTPAEDLRNGTHWFSYSYAGLR